MRETPQKNLEREKPGLAGKGQVREQEPWMLAKEDGNREREPLLTPGTLLAFALPQTMGKPVVLLMRTSLRSSTPLFAQQIFCEEKGQIFSIIKNNSVDGEKPSYHTAIMEPEDFGCISE